MEQRCSMTRTKTPLLLGKEDKGIIQEVTYTFIYYTRAVDCTIHAALSSIATQQASNPTKNTMKKVKQSLYYAVTHPNAIVACRACNIVLVAHRNVL